MNNRNNEHVYKMAFASVYPHHVQKAEKKGRTKRELAEAICWLAGYTPKALAALIKDKANFETFFGEAPAVHPAKGWPMEKILRA